MKAVDQNGGLHLLVERAETVNDVNYSGYVVNTAHGLSHFYSATNGDAVTRLPDGSFKNLSGTVRLWLIE